MFAARVMPYVVLWVRIFFGMHSFMSGSNYFLGGLWGPLPVIDNPLAGPFVASMTAMGLFGVVKAVETGVGVCLLLNRFVPLALVAELSISVTIFYMSVMVVQNLRPTYTGTRELVFNLFLLAAYAGYYLPMLSQKSEQRPIWRRAVFAQAISNLAGGDGRDEASHQGARR